MTNTKEAPRTDAASIEEKLHALYRLQKIDTKIDQIQRLRGELPMEVKDMEDEQAGLDTRIQKIDEEMKQREDEIGHQHNRQKEAEAAVKKYQKQQNNVKNNREFEALTKEIELQKLDIQLADKKIKEIQDEIAQKKEMMDMAKKAIKGKEKELKAKRDELDRIIQETEDEEKALQKKSKDAQSKIEDRLLSAYRRIRSSYKNGLAVVPVKRDACGGCFNAVPPQIQLEIRQHRKIIICEHCGRILTDVEMDK